MWKLVPLHAASDRMPSWHCLPPKPSLLVAGEMPPDPLVLALRSLLPVTCRGIDARERIYPPLMQLLQKHHPAGIATA